jgi:pyruvate/2-oxoglutarate dehydrogenase complex dihydrolipoamide dehydrogenase (E3) component
MHDIIIIGGGPAGVVAALRARELGANVALVERGRMGGTTTNDGVAPTRVLARAARLVRAVNQFSEFGIIADHPEVNWQALLDRAQQTVYRLQEKKQLISRLEQSGVHVFAERGEARFTDPHTIALNDGTSLKAGKFILCVGGHGRRITFPGSEFSITHNDIWQLPRLPRSIIIVGGAATGCQLASIFNSFGVKVTLLEKGPKLLAIEDEIISRTVTASFIRHGITVKTGIGDFHGIEQKDDLLEFNLDLDGKSTILSTEAVLMAVGWVGNLESLNLEAAGVKTERGYVTVNDYLQSSVEHIFAAGDITGRMMLVQSASSDARIAVENAVLGLGQPYKHQIVPHGGFTDPEYASVGLSEEKARAMEPGCAVAVVPYTDLDRAVIDDHAEGVCKLIASQENHRILGVHIVGENALEITQMVAGGMASDMWVEQLAELEIAYPTYTAILGLAARRLISSLGVVPMTSDWRSSENQMPAEWEQSFS